MKNRIHTTSGGDKFLRTHIVNSTPWARDAYRPPARELPADRTTRYLTISAVVGAILGIVIIIAVTK